MKNVDAMKAAILKYEDREDEDELPIVDTQSDGVEKPKVF